MDNKELIKLFNKHVSAIGFKKTRNNVWYRKGDYVTECIYLQKSMFGNLYYFRYGYVINELELEKGYYYHYGRRTPFSIKEDSLINSLLNLENEMSDQDRDKQIKQVLHESLLLDTLQVPRSKDELINYIVSSPCPVNGELRNYLHIRWENDKYIRL